MSNHRMRLCCSCGVNIEIRTDKGEWFHWDAEGTGPFCAACWRWQKQIDALKARVTELERPPVKKRRSRAWSNPSDFS